MAVRAKFRLDSYSTSMQTMWRDGKPSDPQEIRSLKFSPVYSDKSPENAKFFAATPTGTIELGTVNPEAWNQFELGKSYYIDFIKAGD